jgi:type IV secretory pathway VirB2 component (pilin)
MSTTKSSLLIALFLVLFLIPVLTSAQAPFVRCGNPGQKACEIGDFFNTLGYIYNFLVLSVATPLAVIALIIGGIFILISAGNPNFAEMGKKIVRYSIFGLALVFGSWLIIKTILSWIGYAYNF